jgi:chaperone modulatory protein CbpM
MDPDIVISAELVVDEVWHLSLTDLCATCQIDALNVSEMVAEGVVEPAGNHPDEWFFDRIALRRPQMAVRLQRDLGVNLPGAALALDLLEELETLRKQLR